MANKPFSIQESKLRIAGVDLEAGNTTIVIPGVTQATSYRVEEVEDTGDQTQTLNPATAVVVDFITYDQISAGLTPNFTADYTVELDEDGYIDEIQVNGRGTYNSYLSGLNESNDMYAYIGSGSASDRPIVPQDWTQIPFRPRMRAGDIENIGGGGGSGTVNKVYYQYSTDIILSVNTEENSVTVGGDIRNNLNDAEYITLSVVPPQSQLAAEWEYDSGNNQTTIIFNSEDIEIQSGYVGEEVKTIYVYNNPTSLLLDDTVATYQIGGIVSIHGTPSQLFKGGESLAIMEEGDVVFDGQGPGGGVNRGLVWKYGENQDGINSMVRQDQAGLTVRAYTEDGGDYSASVNIVTNQDANQKTWEFDGNGGLTFPDGTTQTTAYTGQSSGGAQLVGNGYVAGTGNKVTVYTNNQGYQGGESTSLLFNISSLNGTTFAVGDTITFRNGEVRTITSYDDTYNENTQVAVGWNDEVAGNEFNPRYPVTFTSQNYVPEVKKTARIKPDENLVSSGQFMDIYAGTPTMLDKKHIHMAGHNVDTELFLGTDNNFVSSKEAGLSPARVNLKSENDITVSDTNLRMTRGNTWVSIYGDSYNTDWRDNNQDLSWDLVETDDQGNFYVGGESHWGSEAMVAKYGPDGDLIWKKIVNSQNTSGWNTQGAAYNPVDKEVAFAIETGINRSYDYAKVTVFDSDTGDVKRTFDVYDPDGSVYVRAMSWHPTLGYMAVGNTSGESATTGSITAIGATGTGIIELPRNSVKIGGQWPQFWGSWRISGTGITGSQTLQGGVGLYYAPVINLTNPSSTGMTTGIRVDYSGLYYENYTQGTAGTGTWDNGDSFKILGSSLGGIDGGTSVSATPSAMSQASADALAFFDTSTYPDLFNQLNACTWTVSLNTVTYNVTGCASTNNGTLWAVTLQNCTDLSSAPMLFTTTQGNDILGLIQDNNNIQNGFSGSPNPLANYRLDMGYQMGYGSTDFTGGTFEITTTLNNTAFVWSDSWSKVFKAENTSSSYAYSIAVDKVYGDIVVGGYENGASRNFVWKLDNTGATQWVKRIDDDNNDVFSVAISSVNRDIYFTTGYNSVNKLTSSGTLAKRVEPQGMWGMNNPIVKLEQSIDGEEYLYVGGSYGAIWSNGQNGFMVSKFTSDLETVWTRSIRNNNRSLDTHYDSFHNNFALGRDKVSLAGYTYFSSFNYDVAFLASITTGDNFETGQMGEFGEWYLEVLGGDITYPNQTNNYAIENCLVNGAATANSTLQLDTGPSGFDLTNWTWKTGLVKLDTTLNGIVGVESIAFADGGVLDHNPSDIPPVVTDFSQVGWNYTLKLSDRGKFITNGAGVENNTSDLYITVPSQWNLSFPVGSVITLINLSDTGTNNNYIYVQPENFGNNDCPRIYATGFGTTWSTWSFPGIQTATLMKIGSNDWLLTANNIQNED